MFSVTEIRNAVDNNEFFLEYQPTMSLADGHCVGAEALIRWRKSDRIVPPMEFIPSIEGTMFSGVITYWVIDRIAKELGGWLHDTAGAHIAINVPPEIWGRGGVDHALRKSHLADVLDKIVLEVTERGVPDKLGVDTINNHGYANVKVALDDVMANEAQLVFLAHLRVDIIKIDKSFTDRILLDTWPTREDEIHLRMLRDIDKIVLVEGVETSKQADVLRKAGVQFAQGWYFSRSLATDQFRVFFENHS